MALYPITQYDFPNASVYDSDLREVLKITKEVYKEYNTMYTEFLRLEKQFDEYIVPNFEAFKKRMNGLSAEIDADVKAEVDAEMEEFKTQFNALYIDIHNAIRSMEYDFERFKAELKKLFDKKSADITRELQDAIDTLWTNYRRMIEKNKRDFKNLKKSTRFYTDAKVASASDYLLSLIMQIEKNVKSMIDKWESLRPVLNPATGIETDVEQALSDVYDADRYGGYTARWQNLNAWSAARIDEVRPTALNWDVYGRWILVPPLRTRNPITGRIENMRKIIDSFADAFIDDAITISDFEKLDITVIDFDGWTAQEYYLGNGIPAGQWYLHSFGILNNEPNLTTQYLRYMLSEIYQKIGGI